MWKTLAAQADTPIRRIGLLVGTIAFFIFLAAAIHWNVRHKGFVYIEKITWQEKVPEPLARPNSYWSETREGWALYDKTCVDEDWEKSPKPNFTYLKPDKCRTAFVPHNRKFRQVIQQSLTDYMAKAFVSGPLGYFSVNATALILLLLGAFLYSGLAEKGLQWIRSGETKSR